MDCIFTVGLAALLVLRSEAKTVTSSLLSLYFMIFLHYRIFCFLQVPPVFSCLSVITNNSIIWLSDLAIKIQSITLGFLELQ